MSYPQVPSDLDNSLKFKRIDNKFCYYYSDDEMYVLKSYDTIVAMFHKKSKSLFFDKENYSNTTSRHESVFVSKIVKEKIGDVILLPQIYLINFIRSTLVNETININIDMPFKVGEYVRLYRLHNYKTRTAIVTTVGRRFNFVEGNNINACTVTPSYYRVCIPNYLDKEYSNTIFCYSRNLKDRKSVV